MLRAVSGNTQNPFPVGMNAAGIKASSGAYGQYKNPVTSQVIAASSIPGFTFDSTYTYPSGTIVETIGLPPNVIGPDGWFELRVDWSCNNSATVKGFGLVFDHTNFAFSDTQTTNTSSSMIVRIRNSGNTGVNLTDAGPVPGGHANGWQWTNADLTKYHSIAIWTASGTLVAGDHQRIESWALTAHNPPVYSSSRLQYGKKIFYGGNSHFDSGQTPAQIIAGMKAMGMKVLRITDEGGSSMSTIVPIAQAFQADNTGLQILLCMDFSIVPYATEAAAYAGTYAAARADALLLSPYGVVMYECGNEMDTKDGININDPQGGGPWMFDPVKTNIFRGVQRGGIAGVRSVPGCIAHSNAYTVCSLGLADMMYLGTNPDGSPAASGPMDWDVTSWHNYEDYGPMTGVEMWGGGPWVNLFQELNRRYGGKPIFITEWNGKQSDTDAQRSVWAKRFMYEAFANRYKYNIAGIVVYELWGGPWNVLNSDGTVQSTFGTTVQSFITNNPDTGL